MVEYYREVYRLAASNPQAACEYISGLINLDELTRTGLNEAADFLETYRRDGVVVLRSIIGSDLVRRAVNDIWRYVLSLPWTPELKAQWELIYETFRENPWRKVTKIESDQVKAIYPNTGSFGAPTLPGAFHLGTQWEIRQDPILVSIATQLLGVDEVSVGLDRFSWKFKGHGETEFCHYDVNPHRALESVHEGIQGIVALCDTSFFAVPGTHTNEFLEEFAKKYPAVGRDDQYYVTKEHDPLGLRGKVKEYRVGPGDYVVWSNRLLHEARKNKSDFVRYAYFISYFPRDNPGRTVRETYARKGRDWRLDRIESYRQGSNPLTFPSGTLVTLYSQQAMMYHPEVLTEFCSRFTLGSSVYTYQSGKKAGQTVQLPVGWIPRDLGTYTPPPLSDLGERLLGLK